MKKNKTPEYTLKAIANYRLKTKQLTLPNETIDKLKNYAKQRNIKVRDAIEDLLKQFII